VRTSVRPYYPGQEDASAMAQHFRLHRTWSWGGVTPFTFGPGGRLSTPWGAGQWGLVPARGGGGGGAEDDGKLGKSTDTYAPRTVFARFVGAVHVLTFEDASAGEGAEAGAGAGGTQVTGVGGAQAASAGMSMFVSERCTDGDMVVGRIVDPTDAEASTA
jgi:hypothetical protein